MSQCNFHVENFSFNVILGQNVYLDEQTYGFKHTQKKHWTV